MDGFARNLPRLEQERRQQMRAEKLAREGPGLLLPTSEVVTLQALINAVVVPPPQLFKMDAGGTDEAERMRKVLAINPPLKDLEPALHAEGLLSVSRVRELRHSLRHKYPVPYRSCSEPEHAQLALTKILLRSWPSESLEVLKVYDEAGLLLGRIGDGPGDLTSGMRPGDPVATEAAPEGADETRTQQATGAPETADAPADGAIRGETAPSARGGCLSERVFSGGNTLSPSGCSPLTSDSGSDPSSPQRGLHLRGLESSSILVLTEGSEPQRANVAQGASSPLNPCPLERGKDGSGGSGGSGGSEIRVLKRAQGARGLRGLERPQRAATLT